MNHTTCIMITGAEKEFIVLLNTSPKFPFNCSNITYVKVRAISLGEATRKAIESINFNIITDCAPIVKSLFL